MSQPNLLLTLEKIEAWEKNREALKKIDAFEKVSECEGSTKSDQLALYSKDFKDFITNECVKNLVSPTVLAEHCRDKYQRKFRVKSIIKWVKESGKEMPPYYEVTSYDQYKKCFMKHKSEFEKNMNYEKNSNEEIQIVEDEVSEDIKNFIVKVSFTQNMIFLHMIFSKMKMILHENNICRQIPIHSDRNGQISCGNV